MLKVKKSGCEYVIPSNRIVGVQEAYDGILITVNDGSEIRFQMSLTPQLKPLLTIVQNASSSKDVVFDIDSALCGRYNEVVKIS